MVTHLTVEQRQLALRLKARGLSLREIGREVGCSHELVRIIARGGPSRPQRQVDPWVPGPGRLGLADREETSLGLMAVRRSVPSRPGWGRLLPPCRGRWPATAAAPGTARGGLISGLGGEPAGPRLRSWPAPGSRRRLPSGWRPGGRRSRSQPRLRIEFAGDPMMWVSHETIYQALFVHCRGELRRELARCLRTGRANAAPATARRTPAGSATWS
jgi:transposase, IS30 family